MKRFYQTDGSDALSNHAQASLNGNRYPRDNRMENLNFAMIWGNTDAK